MITSLAENKKGRVLLKQTAFLEKKSEVLQAVKRSGLFISLGILKPRNPTQFLGDVFPEIAVELPPSQPIQDAYYFD